MSDIEHWPHAYAMTHLLERTMQIKRWAAELAPKVRVVGNEYLIVVLVADDQVAAVFEEIWLKR